MEAARKIAKLRAGDQVETDTGACREETEKTHGREPRQ